MISQKRLKELLHYDPLTGVFTWRVSRGGSASTGTVAGSDNGKGYRIIAVDGKKYLAHRLAFLYTDGAFPENEVDHINGCRDDNRRDNLRAASRSQNLANRSSKGYYWNKSLKKWAAELKYKNYRTYLGLFKTEKEASDAYHVAARKIHGEFYCQ